jgi:integrase
MEPKSQLLPDEVVGKVAQATPEKRTGRKSMSRRSGQNGSVQKDGNWYVVRFWKDVDPERRQRVREKICPISGPGKLSAAERERKAKEIIVASGADTVEHFEKVVRSNHGVTFREQAAVWLAQMRNRRRKPVAPSTLATWECALENWIYPNIGNMPLDAINNLELKNLVTKMVASGKLGAHAIRSYILPVKMVLASATDKQGELLYPRQWNQKFIDAPRVEKPEPPAFTGGVVTGIVAVRVPPKKKWVTMFFALCGAGGLRFGECLGIDLKHISPDCSTIKIQQKVWQGRVQQFLKTDESRREIDLHSSVAAMLREFIGERKSGLLFRSRTGKPLSQSNILRRWLHPILKKLNWEHMDGRTTTGAHAFRRFRDTYLKNYTPTPLGLINFWLGWAGEGMSNLYDKIRHDVEFRKEVAERAGLGFELPSEKPVVGPNGPKRTETPDVQLAVNA